MIIDYETTLERCQQIQRSTDDLEHQAKEDINSALMPEIDTDDLEQAKTKEDINLESSATENEPKALEDELVALVRVLYEICKTFEGEN